jgi:hypothetical protein
MTAYPEPRPQEAPRHGPISTIFRLIFGLLALAIPLFALWLCASMVLAAGAPLWLAITAGVSLVLLLPFFWDVWAEARFSRRQNPPPRILTRADRLRLRILAICVAFSGFLLFAFGPFSTGALVRHGDWVLFGSEGTFATDLRAGIAKVAHALGGLSGASPRHDEVASQRAEATGLLPDLGAPTRPAGDAATPYVPPPNGRPVSGVPAWPLPVEVHPIVTGLGDSVANLDEVAQAILKREADPFQRIKAIHDFVVTWLAYDTSALDPSFTEPSQEVDVVFKRRTATCHGYVGMMLALAERTGDKLTRIRGRTRSFQNGRVAFDDMTHAWVAATIDGRSYLIDPTWNAGHVRGREYIADYSTSYLFTPPEVFIYQHFPDDPDWSLLTSAPSAQQFLDLPLLNAHFFAWGLSLEGISSAMTPVSGGRIGFRIQNPRKAWVYILARAREADSSYGKSYNCSVPAPTPVLELSCPVTPGPWDLQIYTNDEEGGTFLMTGSLAVESR